MKANQRRARARTPLIQRTHTRTHTTPNEQARIRLEAELLAGERWSSQVMRLLFREWDARGAAHIIFPLPEM